MTKRETQISMTKLGTMTGWTTVPRFSVAQQRALMSGLKKYITCGRDGWEHPGRTLKSLWLHGLMYSNFTDARAFGSHEGMKRVETTDGAGELRMWTNSFGLRVFFATFGDEVPDEFLKIWNDAEAPLTVFVERFRRVLN